MFSNRNSSSDDVALLGRPCGLVGRYQCFSRTLLISAYKSSWSTQKSNIVILTAVRTANLTLVISVNINKHMSKLNFHITYLILCYIQILIYFATRVISVCKGSKYVTIVLIFLSVSCSFWNRRSGVRHRGCTGGSPHIRAIRRRFSRPGHICCHQWTDVSIIDEQKHRNLVRFWDLMSFHWSHSLDCGLGCDAL